MFTNSNISNRLNRAVFGQDGIAKINSVAQSNFQAWAEHFIEERFDVYHQTLMEVNKSLQGLVDQVEAEDLKAAYRIVLMDKGIEGDTLNDKGIML